MNETTPKISVIVPVYKAEAYLHRCVDSLLSQTFQDFEILLVDDGSPDKSGEICDEYARKDSRIRVFHKENGGVSSARQYGMDHVQGEYTIHADPDDWVEPTMLEELYKKAKEEDADIVCCNYWGERKGSAFIVSFPYLEETWNDIVKCPLVVLNSPLWNKLIYSRLYTDNHIRFFQGINMQEDLGVTLRLRTLSRKTVVVPKAFYHYNLSNETSMTASRKLVYVNEQIRCALLLEEWFKNNVAAKEGWEKLILSIKFYAKSSLFLYPDIQDIDLWKKTFPESNVGIFGYRLLSKFTRLFMFLCLHKMKYIGMLLNNLKYSIMKNNQHENVT